MSSTSLICPFCDKSFEKHDTIKHHIFESHLKKSDSNIKNEQPNSISCRFCGKCYNSSIKHSEENCEILYKEKYCGKKYQCDHCLRSFDKQIILLRHNQIVHQKVRYQCDQCHKSFSMNFHLKNHIKSIHLGDKYDCDHCDKTFNSKASYTQHMKFTVEKFRKKCDICDQSVIDLREHLRMHKNRLLKRSKENLMGCDHCDKSFTTKSQLKAHILTDHNGILLECIYCEMKFKKRHFLNKHRKTCASKSTSNEYSNFKSNALNIKKEPEERIFCEYCGKDFLSSLYYRHSEYCQITFQEKFSDNPFQCQRCKRSFKMKGHLTAHENSVHKGIKTYSNSLKTSTKCTECSKEFLSKSSLYSHMKSVHDERRFPCDQCEKYYKRKTMLKQHVLVQHKKVTYDCDICGKAFKTFYYLQTHKTMYCKYLIK